MYSATTLIAIIRRRNPDPISPENLCFFPFILFVCLFVVERADSAACGHKRVQPSYYVRIVWHPPHAVSPLPVCPVATEQQRATFESFYFFFFEKKWPFFFWHKARHLGREEAEKQVAPPQGDLGLAKKMKEK